MLPPQPPVAGRQSANADPWRVWTIPNALSVLRLVFIPVFAFSIWQGHMLSAAIILVLASVTDFFDGVIARAFNQRSRLGRLLDPAVDRLYIATALVMLAVVGALPWLVVVLLLARDVILAVHVPIFAHYGYAPISVNAAGKVGAFMLMSAFPLLLVRFAWVSTSIWAQITYSAGVAALIWGAGLYCWSAFIYLKQITRVLSEAVK